MPRSSPREWVRAWKPVVPGISEVFHASFVDHRYPPHTHDDWTVFIVERGAIRYDLDAHQRHAGDDVVTVLPPHVVHDGRASTEQGFVKRVIYVGLDVLPERLIGRAVDEPDIVDRAVRSAVEELHPLLRHADDALGAEGAMARVAHGLHRHLRARCHDDVPVTPDYLARSLRERLDARLFERVTLAEVAHDLQVSTHRLERAFSRTFSISPHRYVIARRIEVARKRLLDGDSVADTAAAVGFVDQAHFTRHFKRHVGATPARFARSGAA